MGRALLTALVGFASGVLSGMFGIGGGVLTTPAIRLLLGYPELIAVGTPLPVILPGALAGALSYSRARSIDVRAGLTLGAWGAPASVAGAAMTRLAGGGVVLIATAVLIVYISVEMVRAPNGGAGVEPETLIVGGPRPWWHLTLAGVLSGLYSGFLGLGGGFVMVPLLNRVFKLPLKRALGTSLLAVAVFAVPGSLAHWYLGNIDPRLALMLVVGVVPGALVGARIAFATRERTLRLVFAGLLGTVGLILGASELVGLGG